MIDWRSAADLPPAALRIHSPSDLEARHATKGDLSWVGYNAHLTEACDDELPHLMTTVVTTPARVHESQVVETIHTTVRSHKRVPAEHVLDAGYVDTELIVGSEQDVGVELVGPVSPDRSWQAKAGQGFAIAHVAIDWEARTVRCPQEQVSTRWQETHTTNGKPVIHVRFAQQICGDCPMREQCVTSVGKGRELCFRPQQEFDALQHARQRQETGAWKQYAARAGIEGTISQGVRRCDVRHARSIGLARTHLQHILMTVARNLVRLYAWFTQRPRVHIKPSTFAARAPVGS